MTDYKARCREIQSHLESHGIPPSLARKAAEDLEELEERGSGRIDGKLLDPKTAVHLFILGSAEQ